MKKNLWLLDVEDIHKNKEIRKLILDTCEKISKSKKREVRKITIRLSDLPFIGLVLFGLLYLAYHVGRAGII